MDSERPGFLKEMNGSGGGGGGEEEMEEDGGGGGGGGCGQGVGTGNKERVVLMWGYLPGVSPQRSPLLGPVPVRLPPAAAAAGGDGWRDVCGGGCGFAMAISGDVTCSLHHCSCACVLRFSVRWFCARAALDLLGGVGLRGFRGELRRNRWGVGFWMCGFGEFFSN